MLTATDADIARFLSYIEVLPSGCWFWTGARSRGRGNRRWYASFRLGRRSVRGHRFSCEVIAHRPCPPGHDRSHTCHFSLCVCPDHLEILTCEENQAQRRSRRAADASGALYNLGGVSYTALSGRLVAVRGEKKMTDKKPVRHSVKATPVTSSAEDAMSSAYSGIEDLRDEIQGVVDAMSESPGLSATSRFSVLEQTVSVLGDVADDPRDWPSELDGAEIVCSYTENRERKLTRAGRRDNASAALSAAAAALRDWADETEQKIADGEPEEGDDNSELEEKIEAARTLADELDSQVGEIDGAEFPGMRG